MRQRRKLSEEPASFWLGAGLVAEFPFMIGGGAFYQGSCQSSAHPGFPCQLGPLPIIVLLLAWFFFIAWAANRLGLGARP